MQYIKKLNHITLSTKDLNQSIVFYQDLLQFQCVAQWARGAYLESGDIWLCLTLEKELDSKVSQCYSHIAFSIHENLFKHLQNRFKEASVIEWKENKSEGKSIYILDPDNHKLEIHCGSLYSRIQSTLKKPFEGFDLFYHPKQDKAAHTDLYGENVKLLPLQLSHAEELYNIGSEPVIWEKMPHEPFKSLDNTIEWIVKSLNSENQLTFTVFNKNEEVVGSTRYLDVNLDHLSLEIGYTWLHPKVWRTAVNTECKYLLLQYAFEQLKFKRVYFKTDVRNQRSQKAIERLGAKKEGVLRASMRLSEDYWRDSVYYSIIDVEWPEVKSNLQELLHHS